MEIQRGFRDKLDKYAASSQEMTVVMKTEGSAVYDYTCFGVDANDKLSDDRYMVFYNQLSSPQTEISFREQNGQACFTLQLSRLPLSVNKLVFTVSIDGAGSMGQIRTHSLSILQNGREVIGLSLTGNDFRDEKAIISIEIYRKDVWRIAAVARGFNGGLGDLLRAYGGEEAEDDASPVGSAPSAQSLPALVTRIPIMASSSAVSTRRYSFASVSVTSAMIVSSLYVRCHQTSGFHLCKQGIKIFFQCIDRSCLTIGLICCRSDAPRGKREPLNRGPFLDNEFPTDMSYIAALLCIVLCIVFAHNLALLMHAAEGSEWLQAELFCHPDAWMP